MVPSTIAHRASKVKTFQDIDRTYGDPSNVSVVAFIYMI